MDRLSSPLTVLVGAGISRGSGIPTALEACDSIMRGVGLDVADIAAFAEKRVPFESFFQALMSVADCARLFDIFSSSTPSLGHYTIAKLAAVGRLDTVLTTNFDTLLEQAFSEVGIAFDLHDDEDQFDSIDWSLPRTRIIKLHGTIRSPERLALTITRVAAHRHVERRGAVVRRALCGDRGTFLILGYSCSDHFDISPAVRATGSLAKDVVYVDHDPGCLAQVCSLREARPGNPFADCEALCIRVDAEEYLRSLWRSVTSEPLPSTHGVPRSWESAVRAWLQQVEAVAPGATTHVAGMIMKTANHWRRSNELLREAVSLGLPARDQDRIGLAIGNNLLDLQEGDLAVEELTRVVETARSKGNQQIEARALNSLGMKELASKRYERALDFFERALALAVSTEDRELEGKAHGNIGIALKNLGQQAQLERAIAHHLSALTIAREIGDKRSEGRTLGNLGLTWDSLGRCMTSGYFSDALSVSEALGDSLHTAMWCHAIAESLSTSDLARATEYCRRAVTLFMKDERHDHAPESLRLLERLDWLARLPTK